MIISVTNPLNEEEIDIEVAVTVNLTTFPDGKVVLSVNANGNTVLEEQSVVV